jgi:glutathione S-transferase
VKKLKLYDYAASANCYKVRLLLAQLELPYERIPVAPYPANARQGAGSSVYD